MCIRDRMIRDINTGKECAPGEVGEILIKGFNMMLGYYKLPYSSQPIDEDGWLRSCLLYTSVL